MPTATTAIYDAMTALTNLTLTVSGIRFSYNIDAARERRDSGMPYAFINGIVGYETVSTAMFGNHQTTTAAVEQWIVMSTLSAQQDPMKAMLAMMTMAANYQAKFREFPFLTAATAPAVHAPVVPTLEFVQQPSADKLVLLVIKSTMQFVINW